MGYSLENHTRSYNVSLKDGFISACTLFSGIPYAYRHGQLLLNRPTNDPKCNKKQYVWHVTMAILESLPLIGGGIALIERGAYIANRRFFNHSHSPTTSTLKDRRVSKEVKEMADIAKTLNENEIERLKKKAEDVVNEHLFDSDYSQFSSAISQGVIAVKIQGSAKIQKYIKDLFLELMIGLMNRTDKGLASALPVYTSFSIELEKSDGDIDKALDQLGEHLFRSYQKESSFAVKLFFCFIDQREVVHTRTVVWERSKSMTPTEE